GVVHGLDLVLDEGPDEVVEQGARKVAGLNRRAQGDEDWMAREMRRVIALVEQAVPFIEQAERGTGAANLVAKVIGDTAEGVEALKVRADALWQKKRGNVKVLVVRGRELVAPGAGFFERRALGRHGVLGRCAGEFRRGFYCSKLVD